MKRCMLAAAVVLALHCGLASADYIIIKVDLNQLLHEQKQPPPQTGGTPVAPPPIIIPPPVMPTPLPGKNPGGKGGKGGKGAAGGGYAQPLPPQIGALPPQGVIGGQPGFGGGVGGQKGKGQKGVPQPLPIMPPIQPGFPIQPGVTPGPVQPPPDLGPQEPPVYVYAYLEVKAKFDPKTDLIQQASKEVPISVGAFECNVGDKKVRLWLRDKDVIYVKGRSVSRLFVEKFDAAVNENAGDTKKQKLFEAAEWALQRGLLAEFNKCIDKIKEFDPREPVVLAVDEMRGELKKRPGADDPTAKAIMDELRKEDYRALLSEQGHYTMLTNIKSAPAPDAELKKKLAKLEDVYATFFLWHAFKGQPRTPPAQRLVVVVVDTPPSNTTDFSSKRQAFDPGATVGSGFTARRDNVMFLASRRTDMAFDMLQSMNEQLWTKLQTNQNEVVNNITSFIKRHTQQLQAMKVSPAEVLSFSSLLQTLAVCQKAMDDENDMVTLSHEGVRQLITATGMLPGNVQTAEWARFGMASFFEVPAQSFYPSTGGPHWTHLIEFKALRQAKLLEQNQAADILLKVVTDDYFHRANDALKVADASKDDHDHLMAKADEQLQAARAVSWSLMYYLMRNRPKELARYFDEVGNLPRDSDYDSKILKDCFGRAFGLMTQDSENPNRQVLDKKRLTPLAAAWFNSMDSTWLDALEVPGVRYETMAIDKRVKEMAMHLGQSGTATTMPAPGGLPPGPGIIQPQPGAIPPILMPPPGIQPGIGGALPPTQKGKKGKGG